MHYNKVMSKTKKQLQSEETKERILRVSTKFLINRSYSGTTISNIANEVGLTKGALYHHFTSKEKLVFEIIKGVKQSWFQNVGRKALMESNSGECLQTLLTVHSRFLQKDPTMCLVLNSLLADKETLPPIFAKEIKGIYNEMLSFIQKIIEKGQASNELQKDLDSKSTAFAIVGMLRWMGCSPLFDLLNLKRISLTESTLKILLRGTMR